MADYLREYIEYYKTLEAPGYAVLVTGDWGVGKTFQVKRLLAASETHYVSLYGLQTIDDVHSAVLAEMNPKMHYAKTFADKAGDTAKSAGGALAIGGLIPSIFSVLFNSEIDKTRTVVFDDLERSGLTLRNVLGVINTYVERFDCRVIIISHDKEIDEGFRATKEKIIGHTIEVVPMVEEAFNTFVSNLDGDKPKEFIKSHQDIILSTFRASEIKSLRILRHAIEDLSRLFKCVPDGYADNKDAMNELIGLFVAFDVEVRCGNLVEEDLKQRSGRQIVYLMRSKDEDEASKPNLVASNEKYDRVDLESPFFQDEALVQMFIKGHYDKGIIRESLDQSTHFLAPEDTPPWKVVINFDELDDATVQQAAARMEEQFKNREVTNSGDLLHIFSLRLMMSKNNVIDAPTEEIADQCIEYIDDLFEAGRLPPRELDWRWKDSFFRAYGGVMYWGSESPNKPFEKVRSHLIESREKALLRTLPDRGEELLTLISKNAEEFYGQICHTNDGDNPFAAIPVLAYISPEKFVATWHNSPREKWYWVSRGLHDRYVGNMNLRESLKSEKPWLLSVIQLLDKEAEKESGFARLRLQRTISPELRAVSEIHDEN